ncbi:hypothetical protein BST13_31120 [Mycobacterium aquaticum]|uniref:Polysaccharide biosynthesis protein n=2 Tax=Mycobacterium aquaticum TaxID=1927124 RepID=A0A1X0AAR2_9MYCO|nr:hypothetical protein BST13_31120 [Mycobacterium aquaticum]
MTASNVIAQAFAYGSLLLLTRWLSPASFGTVSVGAALVYLGVLLVDRGTWGSIVVQHNLSRAGLVRAFQRCLLVAIVLAVIMAASANAVVDKFASNGDAKAVAVLALCLPLHAIAVVPTALLQKSMRFRPLGALTLGANALSAVVAVGMALGGFGVWALVARQLVLFGMLAVLASVLCLPALRAQCSGHDPVHDEEPAEVGSRWFFLYSLAYVLNSNIPYFVVGRSGDAALVGLYSVACTIALAPSTQIAGQVGKVLFAATASQPDTCRERTEQSVQLMSIVMLPLLPIGVLTAPTILPAAFGAEWKPMVSAFQILLVVGVCQAVVDCIVEPITGTGHISLRAKAMVAQCLTTVLALGILVPLAGIRGAAAAQLLAFVPIAAVLTVAGTHRAGTTPRALWGRLRPVAAGLSLQLIVTFSVLIVLIACGAGNSVSACVAAAVGYLACVPVLLPTLLRMRS